MRIFGKKPGIFSAAIVVTALLLIRFTSCSHLFEEESAFGSQRKTDAPNKASFTVKKADGTQDTVTFDGLDGRKLSEILDKAGLSATTQTQAKKKFKKWSVKKPNNDTVYIDHASVSGDTQTFASGAVVAPVFVSVYKVKKTEVSPPTEVEFENDADRTLKEILEKANVTTDPTASGKTFEGWSVEGTLVAKDSATKFPSGASITPKFRTQGYHDISYAVKDINGASRSIKVEVLESKDRATGSQIKAAIAALNSSDLPSTAGNLSGLTGVKFVAYKVGGATLADGTEYDTTSVLVPELELSFTVGGGSSQFNPATTNVTFTVSKIETRTLGDVLKASSNGSVPTVTYADSNKKFSGWKVAASSETKVIENNFDGTVVATGSTIAPTYRETKTLRLAVVGADSNPITVNITVNEGTTKVTWAEIQAAGGTAVTSPAAPSGATGYTAAWQKADGTTPVPVGTEITIPVGSGNVSEVKLAWKKTVSYKVYFGHQGDNLKESKFEVIYPTDRVEKTLHEIFTGTGKDSFKKEDVREYRDRIFTGWRALTKGTAAGAKGDFFTADTIAASNTRKYSSTDVDCFYADYEAHKANMGGIPGMDATAVDGDMTTIADLFIANTEVTQKQWHLVMPSDYPQRNGGYNESNANKPMVHITWYDAVAFCNYITKREYGSFGDAVYYVTLTSNDGSTYAEYDPAKWGEVPVPNTGTGSTLYQTQLAADSNWNNIKMNKDKKGYRLPTMDEWFYVAHGGEEKKYPTYSGTSGSTENDLKKVGWYTGNAGGVLHDVGSLPENTSPVKDMTGNAWELCWGTDEYGNTNSKADGTGYKTGPKLGGGTGANANQCKLTSNPQDTGASKKSHSPDTGFRVISNQ